MTHFITELIWVYRKTFTHREENILGFIFQGRKPRRGMAGDSPLRMSKGRSRIEGRKWRSATALDLVLTTGLQRCMAGVNIVGRTLAGSQIQAACCIQGHDPSGRLQGVGIVEDQIGDRTGQAVTLPVRLVDRRVQLLGIEHHKEAQSQADRSHRDDLHCTGFPGQKVHKGLVDIGHTGSDPAVAQIARRRSVHTEPVAVRLENQEAHSAETVPGQEGPS